MKRYLWVVDGRKLRSARWRLWGSPQPNRANARELAKELRRRFGFMTRIVKYVSER